MSIPRAVSSSLRCAATSTPIARALPRATSNGAPLRASWAPSPSFQRSISSTARQSADKNDPATDDPAFAFLDEQDGNKPTGTTSASQSTPAPASSSPLPWYLQNRPTLEPTQAAILPDLPPNPPPLLQTLLEYIAHTAGMDDLLLYDLRYLDPPPALGSSLIMLLCTARSEKHLHVSADRFCRYLRREHHLRANAAGLLGRNELKIKLRRKAKRMKMLANVGGAEPEGNLDDGIRTGWICCTVGKIQAHPDDTGVVGARGEGEGFVGFSHVKPGVNVVVQMFTEEKRAEIDLETLWGGVLKTHARNDSKADELIKALSEEMDELEIETAEEGSAKEQEQLVSKPEPTPKTIEKEKPVSKPAPPPTYQFNKPRPTVGDVFPSASSFDNRQQLRRLHTVGLRV